MTFLQKLQNYARSDIPQDQGKAPGELSTKCSWQKVKSLPWSDWSWFLLLKFLLWWKWIWTAWLQECSLEATFFWVKNCIGGLVDHEPVWQNAQHRFAVQSFCGWTLKSEFTIEWFVCEHFLSVCLKKSWSFVPKNEENHFFQLEDPEWPEKYSSLSGTNSETHSGSLDPRFRSEWGDTRQRNRIWI